MTVVPKLWGSEEILVNDDSYCMKILRISPKGVCSLHRHLVKDETFLVVRGMVVLEIRDPADPSDKTSHSMVLPSMKSFRIRPGVWHRFRSAYPDSGAVMVECSTHHSDDDVERLIPSFVED